LIRIMGTREEVAALNAEQRPGMEGATL